MCAQKSLTATSSTTSMMDGRYSIERLEAADLPLNRCDERIQCVRTISDFALQIAADLRKV